MTDIHSTDSFERRDKELIPIGNIRNIVNLRDTDMRHKDRYQNCYV